MADAVATGLPLLADGLAHKIRNSLNAMRTHVALAHKYAGSADGEVGHQFSKIEKAIVQVDDTLREFLALVGPASESNASVDLVEVVGEVLAYLASDLDQANVKVVERLRVGLAPVYGDREKLKQATLKLIVNAREAMPEGGTLTVTADRVGRSKVFLEVRDTGRGIVEADLPRVFEPFFSTKPGGLGLSLAVIKRTLEAAGGTISFDSRPGEGTSFRLALVTTAWHEAAVQRRDRRRQWLEPVS